MKKTISPIMGVILAALCANVSAETLLHDDFSDGTTQGWVKGARAGLPVTAETEADGNKYIKLVSEGPESKHKDKKVVFFKEGGKWRGNFTAKGATAITARFKNMGPEPLEMHLAVGNTLADLRSRYTVVKGVVIPNDKEWHEAVFSLKADDFQMIPLGGHGKSSASFSVSETLGNVKEVRFGHGVLGTDYGDRRGPYNGFTGGPEVTAELWIDDIKLIKEDEKSK